jgi:hypothetical protein
MGVDRETRLQSLLGRTSLDHYIGLRRGLLSCRTESNVVGPWKRLRHLLGWFTNVVVENHFGEGCA